MTGLLNNEEVNYFKNSGMVSIVLCLLFSVTFVSLWRAGEGCSQCGQARSPAPGILSQRLAVGRRNTALLVPLPQDPINTGTSLIYLGMV